MQFHVVDLLLYFTDDFDALTALSDDLDACIHYSVYLAQIYLSWLYKPNEMRFFCILLCEYGMKVD